MDIVWYGSNQLMVPAGLRMFHAVHTADKTSQRLRPHVQVGVKPEFECRPPRDPTDNIWPDGASERGFEVDI